MLQGVALIDDTGMKDEEKGTGRIEAFSDGVFAIAIALLALELKKPHSVEGGAEGLVRSLVNQWPSYLSFVTSFCTILIMWGNHHEVFRLVRRANTGFMLANGFLLMLVTVVPFTTALLSDYLTKAGAVVACAVYRGRFCPHQRRLQPPVVRGGEGPRPASERRSGRGHPQVHEKLPTRLSALSAGDRRCFCQPLCHHRHLHGIVGVLGLYDETGRS